MENQNIFDTDYAVMCPDCERPFRQPKFQPLACPVCGRTEGGISTKELLERQMQRGVVPTSRVEDLAKVDVKHKAWVNDRINIFRVGETDPGNEDYVIDSIEVKHKTTDSGVGYTSVAIRSHRKPPLN